MKAIFKKLLSRGGYSILMCIVTSDSEDLGASTGSEDYYYETAGDVIAKKQTPKANLVKCKPCKEEVEVDSEKTGYGPNNIASAIARIPELMDPLNECKCGRGCLRQFEYRPLMESLLEKGKLSGAEFKQKILAELTLSRRFKEKSTKLTIDMYGHLSVMDKTVCKDAYRRLHFIPLGTWNKWHAKVCGNEVYEDDKKGVKAPYNDPSNMNWAYFMEYADLEIYPLAERQPQNATLQCNPLRPADLYANYCIRRAGAYEVQLTQFRKYLREYLLTKQIFMRKRKDCAGKCTICEVLTKQRREVKTRQDLLDWKELNDKHQKDYRTERESYNKRRADGSNTFGTTDSYCFDGAANNNTVCPHFPVKVKSMSDKAGSFFHLHLQAVVMHGVVLFMCLLMPWVPGKDVNMCLTTFNILLRYVATETTRFFRPTCHVQMDGGSENWNRHVFGFFCYLVHYGLYKEIYLHRLPVGHSHNDVDGFFGLLKMKLWGKTADALGYWFITLQEWIHFLVSWVIETVNKQTAIVGCNLDFKTWLDPHLNEDFGGHAGRNRHVHNWCFYIAPDGNVRAMYNFGDRFKEWLPTGVEKNRNLGLILCTSYPAIDSAPDYVDNPSWIRKGQGDKKLDMEKTTQSCMEGLRASTPELVSQKQHEQLAATFPLPLTVESVRERTPERIPPVWNLPLLLTRAHTEAGTIVPDKTLKSRYTLDKQFEVCFDGVNRKRKDVEKEAEKHIDVQEIVMFMRQSKYSTQLISRRYYDSEQVVFMNCAAFFF